jgi:hypothetical protein
MQIFSADEISSDSFLTTKLLALIFVSDSVKSVTKALARDRLRQISTC